MNKNNFDGVRIGLALIVVFAHLSALTQLGDFKYFKYIFDSNFAVKGFFSISGFLVTRSYLTSKNSLEYAEKRFRRIYPAYVTTILLCLFIGAYTTTLSPPDFFKAPQTWRYVISNALFLNFLQPTLPSALVGNPIHTLNGSLWTIKVEVMLYLCVPPMLYLFKRFGTITTATILVTLSIIWVCLFDIFYNGNVGDEIARQLPGQLSYFAIGSLFAVNAKLLSHIKWIAFPSLAMLFAVSNIYAKLLLDPIAYSTIVIYLSTSAFRSMNFGKYGDISYGIYLYHFPIIQLLIFLGLFESNAWLGFTSTLMLTLFFALVSWHMIEKRLLKRTSHYVLATQY